MLSINYHGHLNRSGNIPRLVCVHEFFRKGIFARIFLEMPDASYDFRKKCFSVLRGVNENSA